MTPGIWHQACCCRRLRRIAVYWPEDPLSVVYWMDSVQFELNHPFIRDMVAAYPEDLEYTLLERRISIPDRQIIDDYNLHDYDVIVFSHVGSYENDLRPDGLFPSELEPLQDWLSASSHIAVFIGNRYPYDPTIGLMQNNLLTQLGFGGVQYRVWDYDTPPTEYDDDPWTSRSRECYVNPGAPFTPGVSGLWTAASWSYASIPAVGPPTIAYMVEDTNQVMAFAAVSSLGATGVFVAPTEFCHTAYDDTYDTTPEHNVKLLLNIARGVTG